MKFWLHAFLLASLAVPTVPQVVDHEKWNLVERICRNLECVEETPLKGKADEFEEKSTPLKKTDIRSYRRRNEPSCCGTELPIARGVTNKSREFEFNVKNLSPGDYSVMVEVGGKQLTCLNGTTSTRF